MISNNTKPSGEVVVEEEEDGTTALICPPCSPSPPPLGPYYSQGLGTYRVPMSLYKRNRERVVESMINKNMIIETTGGGGGVTTTTTRAARKKGLILLEGGKQTTRYDTDHEPVFRQESYFHYLFGASQYSDCYGSISLPDGKTTLFVPAWGIDVSTVCGPSPNFDVVRTELGIDEVMGTNDLAGFVEGEMMMMMRGGRSTAVTTSIIVAEEGGGGGGGGCEDPPSSPNDDDDARPKLYLLGGMNTDSGNYAKPAHFEGIERYDDDDVRDDEILFECMAECRVTKVSKHYLDEQV
jgi:Xaa-Pro dipeptidase